MRDIFGIWREDSIRQSKVRDVFTPHQPISQVDLLYGRQQEVARLIATMTTPGQHALLFGERGVGKTSLANVVVGLYIDIVPKGRSFVKRCSRKDTFESIVAAPLKAVQGDLRLSEVTRQHGSGGKISLKLPFGESGAESSRQETRTFRSESALNPSTVAELIDPLVGLLVIDEADAISDRDDRWNIAELMKYLSDNGSSFKILVVGIAETGEELTAAHPSTPRILREIGLGRMDYEELWQILEAGSAKLKLDFDPQVADAIARLSSGYPHFTHLLALKCAEEAISSGRRDIRMEDLSAAMRSAVSDVEKTLLSAYEAATRSRADLYRVILIGAASIDTVEFTTKKLREAAEAYTGDAIPQKPFDGALRRLVSSTRNPILRRVGKGVYRFDDPRMSGFIRIANEMVNVRPE